MGYEVGSADSSRAATGAGLYVGRRSALYQFVTSAPAADGPVVRVTDLQPIALTPEPLPPATTEGEATLTVTALNARLGFVVTAAFLELIGVPVASTERNAKRYHEADVPRICIAIRNHLLGVMNPKPVQA
jgi:hypothetical protein